MDFAIAINVMFLNVNYQSPFSKFTKKRFEEGKPSTNVSMIWSGLQVAVLT